MPTKISLLELEKQTGMSRRDLSQIAKAECGRTRVTTRSSFTVDEAAKIRRKVEESKSPRVRVGEERTVVTEAGATRERVTERRVATKVIKRRRVREAIGAADEGMSARGRAADDGLRPPPAELLGEMGALPSLSLLMPDAPEEPILIAEAEPPVEIEPAPVVEIPPAGEPVESEVSAPEPNESGESTEVDTPAAFEGTEEAPEKSVEPAEESPTEMPPMPPGFAEPVRPKVLGRVDLRKTEPQPSVREPAPPTPDPVEVRGRRGEAPPTEERPDRKRRKLKVIKKDVLDGDRYYRPGRLPRKKKALPGKELKKTEITVRKASKRIVRISEAISVSDLSKAMGVKSGEILKKLMGLGVMATINQVLDHDTAVLVASEFEYTVENVAFDAESTVEDAHVAPEDEAALQPRAPVVTVMGHVDHGKTSLLDAIRKANVTDGEAGGITQHIGAYSVPAGDRSIAFLDTPGHEAFTAMRARGAKVTDLVVLVVAADDGVMPQTIEAIHHARAAEVPILVAVNKIDRPEGDVERVKRELSDHGLAPEDWGGDTIFVPVSAKTKEGLPELLDMILLQADVLELKANPEKLAKGIIVEARLDRGRGAVATVLVQEGSLNSGDAFVCGQQYGRVRAMVNDRGEKLDVAGPSTPVEILGLTGVPNAGDIFSGMQDEATARQVAEHRSGKVREAELAESSKVSLEDLYDKIQTGDTKDLAVVLKADVQGSVEAVQDALQRLSTDEVKVSVLHASVGGISESDVLLASASNAIIVGFNIRPESKASSLAEREGVELRMYTVIYELLQDVHSALEGMLAPTVREKVLGRVEVRQTFHVSGSGTIAGSMVVDGKVQRGAAARLLRDSVVVHTGKIGSLRRFKEDVREVAAGYECGVGLEGYQDVKVSDVIEVFEREEVARRLETPSASRGAPAAEPHP